MAGRGHGVGALIDGEASHVHDAIGAVIVAYNSSDEISDCVRGCLADSAVQRIVVIDNSRDEATEVAVAALANQGRVEYVPASRNLGYAKAVNLGANRLLSDVGLTHIAVVNPDLLLSAPISTLLSRVESRDFSVVSADINDATEETHARFATTARTELKKALLGASSVECVPRPSPGEVIPVPEVSGALMVLRAETYQQLGGFDERFELYYEDVDLCQRAAELAPLLFVGTQVGHHIGGVSYTGARGPAYRAFRVSRLRFLRKRYGTAVGAILGLTFTALEMVTRSISLQPEGFSARLSSLVDQIREVVRPGSVESLLQDEASW